MAFIVGENRVSYEQDGAELAYVTFPDIGGIVEIDHTFVDDSLRGQGIAGKLMERTAETLRQTNRKAKLTCSYAVKWFAEHEYGDVLAVDS
jgi:predicted GNAT family acetyltransferase